MLRLLIIALLLTFSYSGFAAADSLFIISKNDKWMMAHIVKRGETIFSIALQYHVPPAMLADQNGLNYQSGLATGAMMYVPIETFNKATATTPAGGWKPVYYKVRETDNLYRISKNINEAQRSIQEWNNMPDNTVEKGQVLIVARILYSAEGIDAATTLPQVQPEKKLQPAKPDSAKGQKYTVQFKEKKETQSDGKVLTVLYRDTVWSDTLGMYGRLYMQQTGNEKTVMEEKGSAVFYETPGKVKSRYGTDAKNTLIYAFHNLAKRGTIIRVYNPGTDKYVFVKVMGPLPETKQYHNSLIGIGEDAKEILGVLEDKAWVELKYFSK